jgi:hypothetical protein
MRIREFYENGYGVSIVCNEYSYGSKDGLYEIAILKGDEDNWDICYDTYITNDVIGYLTDYEVEEIVIKIKELEKTKEAISKNRDEKINNIINEN